MRILSKEKGINFSIIFSIILAFGITVSCTQSVKTDDQTSSSPKMFVKNPDDVIRSLYLDRSGIPSKEVFLQSWGLNPVQNKNEIKPYFTISFLSSEIELNNGKLKLKKEAKLLNPDFYMSSTNRYNSKNSSDQIWDGRVYWDDNQIIVGGYSSKFNEVPVGRIDDNGIFIAELKGAKAEHFPILDIPSDQIVFDPFDWKLIRIKPSEGKTIAEQTNTYLPIDLYSKNGEELNNIHYTLESDPKNTSMILYGNRDGSKFMIASCDLKNSKITKSIDGYLPELIEGCTQAVSSKVISVTFEGKFSKNIDQDKGSLYIKGKDLSGSNDIADKNVLNKENITVDGDFKDWRNIKGTSDIKGDFVSYLYPNPDTDLLEFKVTNDDKYLYVYSRVVGAHGRTGDKGRYYWYTYIDIDSNPMTGYPPTRDDNCYFGIAIGDDSEAQFEFIGNRFIKTFFGFTGIGAEKEAIEGKLELGPSYYAAKDSAGNPRDDFKVEYVKRGDKRTITHDYTEGTSEDIIVALSPDGSEVEVKVELAGFLKDQSGKLLMPKGNIIDIAVGVEGDSDHYDSNDWGADSTPVLYGYRIK